MPLSDAFDALKTARRNDDGSVLAMTNLGQAALDLQSAIHFETMHRLSKQQTSEPEPNLPEPISVERFRKPQRNSMTLQDRIEQKRKELEQATDNERDLWKKYQEQDTIVREQFSNPWNTAYSQKRKLAEELAVLEGVAAELNPPKTEQVEG